MGKTRRLRGSGTGFCRGLPAGAAAIALASGCSSPLGQRDRPGTEGLRERVMQENHDYLQATAAGGVIEVSRDSSDVEERLSDDRIAELNEISGAEAYQGETVKTGTDLTGSEDVEKVELSLDRAVDLAVAGNLDLQVARLNTRIAEQQRIQAEAAFDAVVFANVDWQKLDIPRPPGQVPGLSGDQQAETFTLNTGIRQRISDTGATVQVETSITRDEQTPSLFAVDRFYDADVLVSLTQPLLRSFGSDVARAQIELSRNAERSAGESVRRTLNELIQNVAAAYWDLEFARRQLLINQRLLGRTIDERDRLVQRAEFDVSPVRLTEANSFVELRRSDVIRARQRLRDASDRLKRLINSPDLPIAGETLIVPVDDPIDQPITFSLVDSVTTAIQRRPELGVSLLNINDAGIRQRVADNGVLPQLDLTAAIGFNGIDIDDWAQAYDDLSELNYIDYILGLSFEQPLGNRPAEAQRRQRRLERDQAVVAYRRDVQDVVLEVKNALRAVLSNYELVGATRASRWAAADSLRAINVREEVGAALTSEFLLDLKLNAQQRLADAETQEALALANYMTSIAELYRAMGTLLERYGIEVE